MFAAGRSFTGTAAVPPNIAVMNAVSAAMMRLIKDTTEYFMSTLLFD